MNNINLQPQKKKKKNTWHRKETLMLWFLQSHQQHVFPSKDSGEELLLSAPNSAPQLFWLSH